MEGIEITAAAAAGMGWDGPREIGGFEIWGKLRELLSFLLFIIPFLIIIIIIIYYYFSEGKWVDVKTTDLN